MDNLDPIEQKALELASHSNDPDSVLKAVQILNIVADRRQKVADFEQASIEHKKAGTISGVRPCPTRTLNRFGLRRVQSDVGSSYDYAESGLSQISLESMLCEAVSFGLVVNPQRAEAALGRIPPSPPLPADASAPIHNSLTFWRWLLEFLPLYYYDPVSKRVKWWIPRGSSRSIPAGSVLHVTVNEKLKAEPKDRPRNLPPPKWPEEQRNSCRFEQQAEVRGSHCER